MRAAILISLVLAGCTQPEWTVETLRKSGFREIRVLGYGPFACGKDDAFATRFSAVNSLGDRVEGTVCCGFPKACTVRF